MDLKGDPNRSLDLYLETSTVGCLHKFGRDKDRTVWVRGKLNVCTVGRGHEREMSQVTSLRQ